MTLNSRSAPITREGELFGVVSTIRDISALKQVERMKDAFVSNVSHELRTPITSLKLNHSLLEMNPNRSAVYLERMGREIDRLNELIEDLLRLSRLEQGKVELHLEQVSLGVIAGEYAKDRMPLANDRKISLFLEDNAKSDLIFGDPGLVGQALSVLLTNALNYTPPGGQIMVCTIAGEVDGEYRVGIEVSDTGPGIVEEDLPLIFQRFFRGKTGLESRAPGTGLGLAIAAGDHERTPRHNRGRTRGHQWAGSQLQALVSRASRKITAGDDYIGGFELTQKRILLVEDEDVIRESVAEILELNGFQVLTASDGLQALSLLENETPDLILADIMMPQMNGYQFFQRVRSNPDWVWIPFIFLSAKGAGEDVRFGKELGADDYLRKPIDAEVFDLGRDRAPAQV